MNRIDFGPSREDDDDELAPYAHELCANDLVLRRRNTLPPPAPDETPPDEALHNPSNDPVLRLQDQTFGGILIAFHLDGAKNPGFSVCTF